MNNPITSVCLIVLTGLAAAAGVIALRRLGKGDPPRNEARAQGALVGLVMLGAVGVFAGRWVQAGHSWQPVQAHVDGLTLIAALLAAACLFIQTKPRLYGLSAFALPLLTLLLAWAICASAWTYRLFDLRDLGPVWLTFHLTGVYLGTLCAAVGAIAGGMYLYVQHRLKHKQNLRGLGRLASLETLETLVIRAATLGFALLSLGLSAGVVIVIRHPDSMGGPGWWHSPKVLLAVTAWVVYAVVINVRHSASFRGGRAAWLAILGLVLLIATVVAALPSPAATQGPRGQGAKGPSEESIRGGISTHSAPGPLDPSAPSAKEAP